jgi:hypothetical protein
MLVPPLKRERTESSRGRLNIRVAIIEFYCDRPGRFAGLLAAFTLSITLAREAPAFTLSINLNARETANKP